MIVYSPPEGRGTMTKEDKNRTLPPHAGEYDFYKMAVEKTAELM